MSILLRQVFFKSPSYMRTVSSITLQEAYQEDNPYKSKDNQYTLPEVAMPCLTCTCETNEDCIDYDTYYNKDDKSLNS